MAVPLITPQESDHVTRLAQRCKALVEAYGEMLRLDAEWAGAIGYNTAITQNGLDSVASFGGLTTQQLADAEFALATIKTQIGNSLVQLDRLALLG